MHHICMHEYMLGINTSDRNARLSHFLRPKHPWPKCSGRNVLHSHKHDDDHYKFENSDGLESHIQCDFSNEYHQHTRIQMGGTGDPDPPPGKLQNIGFLSKTGPDPL